MAYVYTLASDLQNISEQEYGTANEIQFTNFNSCIGVVARKGNNVTGVHLVIVSTDQTIFDNVAAEGCVNLLPDDYDEVIVYGIIETWSLVAGYQRLLNLLNNERVISCDEGIYGFRVHNGRVQVGKIVNNVKVWSNV